MDKIEILQDFYKTHKIATLDELKGKLLTTSHMTIYRILQHLGYFSSVSHRGKYYTLKEIPEFDYNGLWIYRDIFFSKFNTLKNTLVSWIHNSPEGYTVNDINDILPVDIKKPLLGLIRNDKVSREKIAGYYIYLSSDKKIREQQILRRNEYLTAYSIDIAAANKKYLAHEVKAAIILFFSILDEQQRRLFAGLESIRKGHGGDTIISALLGLNPHTIARGREELLKQNIEIDRIRKEGGGRKQQEKKRLK